MYPFLLRKTAYIQSQFAHNVETTSIQRWFHISGTQRCNNVDTALIERQQTHNVVKRRFKILRWNNAGLIFMERLDVESALNWRCFNVVYLLGFLFSCYLLTKLRKKKQKKQKKLRFNKTAGKGILWLSRFNSIRQIAHTLNLPYLT